MPKTKQTNIERIYPFIRNEINNSVSNVRNNIISSNNVHTDIKPKFPPILTTDELIKNAIKSNAPNNKVKTLPNAFIAYRMALQKEYHNKNIKLPLMSQLSKIAKASWDEEPEDVKKFYKNLTEKARTLYSQKTIQIVFDKHMNEVENYQGCGNVSPLHAMGVTFEADSDISYNNQTRDVENMIHTQHSSSGYSTIENSTFSTMDPCFGNGSTSIPQVGTYPKHNFLEDPNNQEYKKMLVQLSFNLFIHELRQNYLF
ncbi:12331_t:CDS:1 [Funneliformis geosporum]|uniref:7936_t:CDS:1 n=1 Tax=Funneliformis geosporum TaxID=1117311 RepID=A0A9W4SHL9_9GLOM|nr:7936_t:CDS:1 [Funneliformis geosporum]CAI2180096.1 12331_t:CDS:1 [Funneliformis geosporum]